MKTNTEVIGLRVLQIVDTSTSSRQPALVGQREIRVRSLASKSARPEVDPPGLAAEPTFYDAVMTQGYPPTPLSEEAVQAGWYPDQNGVTRYWDGGRWTEHVWPSPWTAGNAGRGLRLRFAGALAEVALAATVLSQIVFIKANWERLSLFDRAVANPHTVSFAALHSADGEVHSTGLIVFATYAVAGTLFVAWFYRARISAEQYNLGVLRFGRGWAIGSWITPILGLWRPYQMTTDVLSASELSDRAHERDRRAYLLLRVWWIVFVASTISLWFSSAGSDTSVDAFKTQSRIVMAGASLRLIAAILAIAVVERITAANDRRRAPEEISEPSAEQTKSYPRRVSKSRRRTPSRRSTRS
jgi:cytochrome c oxidase subunit IV